MNNTISSSVPKVPFVPKSFLFLCLAPACTDYLDVRPENQLLPEDFRQKESDVEAALMACYRAMQEDEFMWRVIVWGGTPLRQRNDFRKRRQLALAERRRPE